LRFSRSGSVDVIYHSSPTLLGASITRLYICLVAELKASII